MVVVWCGAVVCVCVYVCVWWGWGASVKCKRVCIQTWHARSLVSLPLMVGDCAQFERIVPQSEIKENATHSKFNGRYQGDEEAEAHVEATFAPAVVGVNV